MPHQCTDCARQFDDGSKEMLSGCPNCGGTKFQFLPDGQANADPTPEEPATVEDSTSSVARTVGSAATAVRDFVGTSSRDDGGRGSTEQPPAPTSGGESTTAAESAPATEPASQPASGSTPETADRGTAAPSVSSETASPDQLPEPEPAAMQTADAENDAQASARSEVVSPDELPPAPEQSGWDQTTPTPETEPETDDTAEHTDRPDLSELRAELNQQFESIKVLEPGQYELNLMELFDREEYIIALQEDGKYTVQVPEHWQE
jgi:predicted  nucleic acid-binding Zn-ribbon protein